MIGIYKDVWPNLIRLRPLRGLIFFSFGLIVACHQPNETSITIRWQGNRAIGIVIPQRAVNAVSADSLDQIAVRLAGKETAMLGRYQVVGDDIIFEPVVPFTRGLGYTVWRNGKQLGEVTIPALAADDRPTLLTIYPSSDSLPDNLLKIYLHFSRPMRDGQSRKYVAMLKNAADTLPGVFLDLQPELWNADRTLLTLWLDPGRIKRDLQPNKRLGAPLQTGGAYQVVVSGDWADEQGAVLGKPTQKTFRTIPRDSLPPVPARWTIQRPKSGSGPLEIAFGEALDYSLLTETLHILHEDGNVVSGKWQPGDEEKRASFTPDAAWLPGWYRLRIESRLEDLAGNNINRPFDRDITRPGGRVSSQRFTEITFRIP